MTDGNSTSQLGTEASTVLQDLNNAAQAAVHGDGTGKTAALQKALSDTESALSKEGIALVERLVAWEASHSLGGIENLVVSVAAKIGGLL